MPNFCRDERVNISGRFRKMLRDTRPRYKSSVCWQNSVKKTNGKVYSKREDGSRNLHSPFVATQACCRLSQFF